jgi:prophage maintenance system killer protein
MFLISINKKSYILFLVGLFAFSLLQAMEQDLSEQLQKLELRSQEVAKVDVRNIKPFSSQAFGYIPQYVYENVNQGTKHTWSVEHFKKLKKAVHKLTEKKLHQKYPNDKDYTKTAEEYDWIYCLNCIEENYLKKPIKLSIADIQKINGHLSRLVVGNDGAFREKYFQWSKRTITDTEHFFYSYLGAHKDTIRQGTDPYLHYTKNESGELTNHIAIQEILELLTDYKLNPQVIHSPYKFELKPIEVLTWYEELAKFPNHKPDTIDILPWQLVRYHFFPASEVIVPELTTTFKKIDLTSPVEAAARLWYEIVRIHPWEEANKRTGKVLASLILLKNGYLPPLITAEHEKEYLQSLMQGFEKEDGHVQFIQLIARFIEETQNKFKGITV